MIYTSTSSYRILHKAGLGDPSVSNNNQMRQSLNGYRIKLDWKYLRELKKRKEYNLFLTISMSLKKLRSKRLIC